MAHKDFATSTVLTAPSPATSGTSLVVQSGHGVRFQATPFYATAHPEGTLPTVDTAEVVLVTAKSTDTFTITRAQKDTTAKSIEVGWRITAALYADEFDNKDDEEIEVTVATARATAAKVGTTPSGTYTPAYGDRLNVTFTPGISVASPTLNIDGSGAINIRLGTSNVTTALLSTAASSVVVPMFYDGTYYQIYGSQLNTDTNTTYAEITEAEITTGTASTARSISGRRSEFIVNKARDRAGHTGTQTASTISDFDTEVSNNTTVTSKITGDGTAKLTTGAAAPTSPSDGDLWVDTDEDDNTNLLSLLASSTLTLTNKTIDGDDNTITNAAKFHIGIISGATLSSTGNKAITGVGFTPKLVRFAAMSTSASSSSAGYGAMTSSAQWYLAHAADGTTGQRFSSSSGCIAGCGPSGSLLMSASYVSMDADGFTINVVNPIGVWTVTYEAYG